MPFSLFLAFKYLKPKRSVTSVITCVSVLGVLLGVAVVIIVRAVMTGFGDKMQETILDFKPHVMVSYSGRAIVNADKLAEKIAAIGGVTAVSPEIQTPVMLCKSEPKNSERHDPVAPPAPATPLLIGVDPDRAQGVYKLEEVWVVDNYKNVIVTNSFFDSKGESILDASLYASGNEGLYQGRSIVLGRRLASKLGVGLRGKVMVYSPTMLSVDDGLTMDSPKPYYVRGIFSSGRSGYDENFAFCSLGNARELMEMEEGTSHHINIKTEEPVNESALGDICKQIGKIAPGCHVSTWRDNDKELFDAVTMEKNMTAILLLLVTVVALFCVMNTLLVLTVQKTSEIGLLKALGFSRLKIMGAFIVHGLVQVTAGTVLGLAAAYAVLRNLNNIIKMLARFGVTVFPENIYHLTGGLPYRLVAEDVVWVVVIVYVFGLLASLVPAFLAASKNPVEALKG